jgi:hypothetical protein
LKKSVTTRWGGSWSERYENDNEQGGGVLKNDPFASRDLWKLPYEIGLLKTKSKMLSDRRWGEDGGDVEMCLWGEAEVDIMWG